MYNYKNIHNLKEYTVDYCIRQKWREEYRHVMMQLEIDSHCSGCGIWLPKFSLARSRKWGHYYVKAYGMDSQKWYKGGFFEGKYCSKFCSKRILEYNDEYDKYPPYHQLRSRSGFFESFNIRYKDLLSRDESLIYNDDD